MIVQNPFFRKPLVPVAAFLLLLTISFVAALYPGVDEMVDPDIGLEVQRTWVSYDGPEGLSTVGGKALHHVEVDMRNGNKAAPMHISPPHFYARTDDGSRVWVHNSEDFKYLPLGPGENVTVHLIFMVKAGVALNELEYVQRVSGPVRCRIPPL